MHCLNSKEKRQTRCKDWWDAIAFRERDRGKKKRFSNIAIHDALLPISSERQEPYFRGIDCKEKLHKKRCYRIRRRSTGYKY